MTKNKYAAQLTALAAGSAILTHKAIAQIVVVEVNYSEDFDAHLHLYVNPAGTNFETSGFSNAYDPGLDMFSTGTVFGANTTNANFVGTGTTTIYNLTSGTTISSGSSFINSASSGGFDLVIPADESGYLGYSVPNQGASNDQTWYGWVQFTSNSSTEVLSITRYAFNNAGGSINAGQTSAVPEPGITAFLFGAFALGLIGISRWKQSKRQRAIALQHQL